MRVSSRKQYPVVRILDPLMVYDNINLGRRIDPVWPEPEWRAKGNNTMCNFFKLFKFGIIIIFIIDPCQIVVCVQKMAQIVSETKKLPQKALYSPTICTECT